jgi:hypothetical protein
MRYRHGFHAQRAFQIHTLIVGQDITGLAAFE